MDSVSDLLTQIRNGYMAKLKQIVLPWSKLKENLAKILVANGYLTKAEHKDGLVLTLKYDGKVPAVTEIKRVSKPSLRIYATRHTLPKVIGGMGIAIISTPKGLMTNREAHKEGIGGEVICQVW